MGTEGPMLRKALNTSSRTSKVFLTDTPPEIQMADSHQIHSYFTHWQIFPKENNMRPRPGDFCLVGMQTQTQFA